MTLADIGTGDGLIAFPAIDRIGPSLRVLLTDISAPLLGHSEALAVQCDVRDQCTFIECSAEVLRDIDDASVDAVTTRAVLAYSFHLLHRWKASQYPDTEEKISESPITNYSERDLVRFALDAGFAGIHMQFHIDVRPSTITSREVFLGWSPTRGLRLSGSFSRNSYQRKNGYSLSRFFARKSRATQLVTAERTPYLTATKPLR